MPLLKIVVPRDYDEFQDLARRLLAAAADEPQRVRTITSTPRLAFEVDEELLQEIGYFVDGAGLQAVAPEEPPADPAADAEPPADDEPRPQGLDVGPAGDIPASAEPGRPASRKPGKKSTPAPPSGDVTETEHP